MDGSDPGGGKSREEGEIVAHLSNPDPKVDLAVGLKSPEERKSKMPEFRPSHAARTPFTFLAHAAASTRLPQMATPRSSLPAATASSKLDHEIGIVVAGI